MPFLSHPEEEEEGEEEEEELRTSAWLHYYTKPGTKPLSQAEIHDSIEDARTALLLYRHHLKCVAEV